MTDTSADIPRPTFRWFMRDGLPPTRGGARAPKTARVNIVVVAKTAPATGAAARVNDEKTKAPPILGGETIAVEMKRQRLATEAKIESMNARSRERWGRK